MSILEVQNLCYDYVQRFGITHVLKGVSGVFESGKLYALTGRSGSGKSTLLSLLAGFDRPKEGKITLDGEDISAVNPSLYRKEKVGVIFQAYNLIPHLTVVENVMLGYGEGNDRRVFKAQEALFAVGLEESHFRKKPSRLSGGEQQRVAIARALISPASVILADEPTGNLDDENSRRVAALLQDLAHRAGKCVIVVTHSRELAAEADVQYRMADGTLV
ncbi:MAG: ABC transporter ATP-binding protein [Ruminococcaceae bacterium]|nr:ABC transporter ATP-binding protein [Oscillospiraceae bacterium]